MEAVVAEVAFPFASDTSESIPKGSRDSGCMKAALGAPSAARSGHVLNFMLHGLTSYVSAEA
jgi:hypothetical protein